MNDKYIVLMTAIICITLLGIVYFITVRQDGSVLATLSTAIGGIVGYQLGKKKGKEEE